MFKIELSEVTVFRKIVEAIKELAATVNLRISPTGVSM